MKDVGMGWLFPTLKQEREKDKMEIETLKALYDEIDELISKRVTYGNQDFQAWHQKVEITLCRMYGSDSVEVSKFKRTSFESPLIYATDDIERCKKGLETCKSVFELYLNDLQQGNDESKKLHFDKVFLVHGKNENLKQSVARLLDKQGIKAVILSEKVNQGKTIIEKFEEYGSTVGAAICLFTADDVGKFKDDVELQGRARQNVVFETGYFIGRLGRDRIVVICDRSIELPSDLQGVVYTDNSQWETNTLRELKSMGFNIDFNKQFE